MRKLTETAIFKELTAGPFFTESRPGANVTQVLPELVRQKTGGVGMKTMADGMLPNR